MPESSSEQFVLRVMSGEQRGALAASLRLLLAVGEPFYSLAMLGRNTLFSKGVLKSHRLPHPVISVGNITAGGTGKTPMVRWLAESLVRLKPAILLRGYRAGATGGSDEAAMLRQQLGSLVPVEAQRDRVLGANAILARSPDRQLFILDDGFQHRRVKRDFDLVLVSAIAPFGFGHVHPRGLLREPLRGLCRADAFVITLVDHCDAAGILAIDQALRRHNPAAPIFHASHKLSEIVNAQDERQSIDRLKDQRVYAFSGIGNPASFNHSVAKLSILVGSRWFPDHHAYSDADLAALERDATAAGAELLVTTEKDWAKLRHLAKAVALSVPLARVDMHIEFQDDGGLELLKLILAKIFPTHRSEMRLDFRPGASPGEA